jgi:iron complex outermembrane receptor protein
MFYNHFSFSLFLLTILLYTNAGISQSCDHTVKGQVRDFHEDHTLEYATIFIQELKTGVTTDETGKFEINKLCKGEYHFIISHIGCATKTIFISIQQDTTFRLSWSIMMSCWKKYL